MSIPDRNEYHVYARMDRPDVEVLVDGDWQPGEATARWHDDAGDLWYAVNVRMPGGHTRRPGDFPATQVRLDTVDRAGARTVT